MFTHREQELAQLSGWHGAASGPLNVVISGVGGAGKTSLALRWLYKIRDQFPDWQLYMDLGGFSPTGPVTPDDVLEAFLTSLGVPAERIPRPLAARAALYRSVTGDRPMVVLLDNAASAAQVRPLLPANPRAVAVVTSRGRLTGLAVEGARFVDLDPLDEAASMALLHRFVDDARWQAEPNAVRELARLCGGLPLALSVVGARLAARPRRRVAREVEDLKAERRRLANLSVDEELSVQAVFDMSYRALPPLAAGLYRACALHPGPDFALDVIVAALDEPADSVEDGLDLLAEVHLLGEIDERRYRFHDLVRLHARQAADRAAETNEIDQATIVRHMIEWYLDVTVAADLLVHPLRDRLGPRYHQPRERVVPFTDAQQALSWLAAERANLFAALRDAVTRGFDDLSWQFCEALWGWFLHYRRYEEWIEVHHLGIAAAARIGDRLGEARLHSQLGFAYAKTGRYQEAVDQNRLALAIGEAEQHGPIRATALSQLGRSARELGDLDAAVGYYIQARDLQAELGIRRGVALCQRRIGEVRARQGRYAEAIPALTEALTIMRDLGDRTQHARTLQFLGITHISAGQPAAAIGPLTEALDLMLDLGSAYYQAEILAALGQARLLVGDLDLARDQLTQARDLYTQAGDPTADRIQERLTELAESSPAGKPVDT